MCNIVVVGIGSNISPDANIKLGLKQLEQNFILLKCSEFVTTSPIGIEDQPDFVNGAVRFKTSLNIDQVTQKLKEIEDQLGRDRSQPKFGPRVIDLDIVMWNGKVVDQDYYSRSFLRVVVDQIKG